MAAAEAETSGDKQKDVRETGGNPYNKDIKMSCCAVGCKNRHGQSKDIHFHRIPSTKTPFDAERRCLWLQAINRTDWSDETIRNARICSVHFISGKVFAPLFCHVVIHYLITYKYYRSSFPISQQSAPLTGDSNISFSCRRMQVFSKQNKTAVREFSYQLGPCKGLLSEFGILYEYSICNITFTSR